MLVHSFNLIFTHSILAIQVSKHVDHRTATPAKQPLSLKWLIAALMYLLCAVVSHFLIIGICHRKYQM